MGNPSRQEFAIIHPQATPEGGELPVGLDHPSLVHQHPNEGGGGPTRDLRRYPGAGGKPTQGAPCRIGIACITEGLGSVQPVSSGRLTIVQDSQCLEDSPRGQAPCRRHQPTDLLLEMAQLIDLGLTVHGE